MTTNKIHFSPPPIGRWQRSHWKGLLVAVLTAMLWTTPHSVQAQGSNAQRDVITFTGGAPDPNDPNIYVIDAGLDDVIIDPDSGNEKIRIQLSRPLGATATHSASITLNSLFLWDKEGTTVTFAPGETEKTVDIEVYGYVQGSYNGNAPAMFSVLRTNRAEAAYEALIYNINRTATEEPAVCEYATPVEALQAVGFDYREIYCFRWGNYMLFSFNLATDVRISADSRLVLQTRYVDHTNLPIDADDYGMSKIRNVVLTPINAGAVSDVAMYLYRPSDDEYMYSLRIDNAYNGLVLDNREVIENDEFRNVLFGISELGPFEVANPAEGAMTSLFFSQEDLQNTFFLLNYPLHTFIPEFSNVSIDKTSYKSGETMAITATMDNWRVMKRAHLRNFMTTFGVTLDGGQTTEPRRFTFDEQTGTVTYYATAPTVATNTTVNVDFGPLIQLPIMDDTGDFLDHYDYQVTAGSEGFFTVTVSPEPAPAVPATAIDFVDMPADGSNIHLETSRIINPEIVSQQYSLAITSTPAGATNVGNVTYSVTNNGTNASINTHDDGSSYLDTGNNTGDLTVIATLPSGVSTSRTYHLTTDPYKRIHTANTYLAGTTLPKFQFEINGWEQLELSWDWTAVNDDVTVNYTHANGTTWTEHYQFSHLNSSPKVKDGQSLVYWGGMSKMFDLPFVFTDEHPDATIDQIGQTIVSAEVIINMQNPSGHRIQVVSTASLEPRLKDFSFKGYTQLEEHYHMKSDPTLTSEVMYLPTRGFIVGYEIPELGLRETYDSQSGNPVPDWLELESDLDSLYTNAFIKVHPNLDRSQSYYLTLYTLAQRSYDPDEVMQRDLTCNVNFSPISPEGHVLYRVNGENVTGDLTFDNAAAVETVTNQLKTNGFISIDNASAIEDVFNPTKAYFTVYENIFEGADVTLTRQGDNDTIQTLTRYNGTFMFMPPSDGHTYIIDVYYPAFDKHYKSTFVSHPLTGIRKVALKMYGKYVEGTGFLPNDYVFTYTNDSTEYNMPFSDELVGFIYVKDADEFFLTKNGEDLVARFSFPEEFHAVVYNNTPELKTDKELHPTKDLMYGDWVDRYYSNSLNWTYGSPIAHWRQRTVALNWDNMMQDYTIVTLVDSKGQPVTNATLNYACVDKGMSNPTRMGSATYNSGFGGYQIETDIARYAELIEVVLPGREHPMLHKMNLWNYNYLSEANRNKARRHTIVLQDNDAAVSEANLETLTLKGSYNRLVELQGYMKAENTPANLLTIEKDTLDYSEAADYPTVWKVFKDERFGTDRRAAKSFARISFSLHSDNIQSTDGIELVNNDGTVQLSPDSTYTRFIGKDVFTTFSTNHWLLDFDLCEKIPAGATEKLALVKNGNETLMELPLLHNNSVDMLALTRETKFDGELTGYDLTKVDDEIKSKGNTDMGKIGNTFNAFRSFNFSTPPTIPFTINIERKDDYFLVRGIYEQNFIPYGQLANLMDAAAYKEWFDEQFKECMNAVNNKRNDVEDRVKYLKQMSSGFAGIKAYISGIGHYNPKTDKLDITFYDGGIIFEASARVMGRISVANIAQFGVSIGAGAFHTLGVQNRAAANGDAASKPQIDIITDTRFNLSVGAWAEVSLDIYIAKAAIGVMGCATIDVRTGTVLPTYNNASYAGTKVSFDFNLSAYLTGKFLWWGGTKDYTLLKGHEAFYNPNNATNPYHPSFKLGEPIFSMSRQNVTKNFKKLSRKTRRALDGTSLFDNVSGMAQPTYLLGGQSLLFNNLKTASNYNDDRMQVFTNGSKSDFVDTGVEAPMYDFAEDHSSNTELVAFEQLNNAIDGTVLESYDTNSQMRIASEMSDIHVAWRSSGGNWQTQKIGSMEGAACVSPAVAVSKENRYDTHAAVIWQQGKTKFSDMGARYIDGSLMLSRFNGNRWSEPVEIMRINRRSVPVEYKMAIKNNILEGDEVLVAIALKQDINNPTEPTKLVYLNVTAEDYSFDQSYKVRTRYTNVEAKMLQMERVLDPNSGQSYNGVDYYFSDAINLVSYMEYTENGRDLKLTTVNMKGEPTGKLNSNVKMADRMINDYRLVVDDNARDLSGVALLWNQSDQETTDNGDGTATVEIKNRIYVSKLSSEDNQLYFSSPIAVADIDNANEKMILASMDGYLDGLDMKVAYCAANFSDAAAVREVPVTFTNDIEHTASFNPYDVSSTEQVPITITVENKGYEPINRIDVTMGGNTTSHDVKIMPMEKMDLKVLYPVTDDFDGTISYDVAANFTAGNSNALKMKRKGVKAVPTRPRRIQQNGTQMDVRQVDMALKVLSVATEGDETTIVAEVNNASLLPLANDMNVKVGLYNSPLIDQNAVSFAETTISAADLYDATTKQNKVKIVTLTVQRPDFARRLYLSTTPMVGETVLTDVRPTNNVLPVSLVGKYLLGDANVDKKVNVTDVTAIINHMNGDTSDSFNAKAANANGDDAINIADVTKVINMINK